MMERRKDIINMSDLSFILENKKSINSVYPIRGIYFLIDKEEIVYIGKSKDIHFRISTHLENPDKIFTHYYIIKTNLKTNRSLWLESEYIMKFKPKYNSSLPGPRPFKTPQEINKESGTNNLWKIRKYIKKNHIKMQQFNDKFYVHIMDLPNFCKL